MPDIGQFEIHMSAYICPAVVTRGRGNAECT